MAGPAESGKTGLVCVLGKALPNLLWPCRLRKPSHRLKDHLTPLLFFFRALVYEEVGKGNGNGNGNGVSGTKGQVRGLRRSREILSIVYLLQESVSGLSFHCNCA